MDNIEKQIIDRYEVLNTARNIAQKDFVKGLITISTAFLALFIGLKSEDIDNMSAKLFYFITVLLLISGILLLSFSLYVEIYFIDKNQTFLKSMMKKYHEGTLKSYHLNVVGKPWYYKLSELIGYLSLIFSLVSLAIYIYFIQFNGVL